MNQNNNPDKLKIPLVVYRQFPELTADQELILTCLFVLYDGTPFIVDLEGDPEYFTNYDVLVKKGFIDEIEQEDEDEDYEGVRAGMISELGLNYLLEIVQDDSI